MSKKNVPSDDKTRDPESGFPLFEVWKQYERVAMHFNDLLLRIRTQSLAAVATVGTVAGIVLKTDSVSPHLRWGLLCAVFASLTVFWIAIWILDFSYDNRLLLGAVKALLALEEASKSGRRIGRLDLSTEIETVVRTGGSMPREYWGRAKGRWCFYILVFLVLVLATIACIERFGGIDELWRAVTTSGTPAQPLIQPTLIPKKLVRELLAFENAGSRGHLR